MVISLPEQDMFECLRGVLAKGIHDVDIVSKVFIIPGDQRKPAALPARKVHPSVVMSGGGSRWKGG